MKKELAYALITPYSILKSRTGGIIARLLTLANLDLVGARMYMPSDSFVDRYCQTIKKQKIAPKLKQAILDYINDNLRKKNKQNISNRTILLLFEGKGAINSLRKNAVGSMTCTPKGDTVRGTYGDFITSADGNVIYFEPAVLTSTDDTSNNEQLALFAEYALKDGGIFENALHYDEDVTPQTTLVILKPENFAKRSIRPGNIIDVFSKTGLFIVGLKLLRLSVQQAEEFYKPLKGLFVRRLKSNIIQDLKECLSSHFDFNIDEQTYDKIADLLKEKNAVCEFNRIVEYMTGVNPDDCAKQDKTQCGREKCLALLYQGEGAVQKIRDRLGPTDPTKAEAGTVRSDFGRDLMKNGAHASDSVENAKRERKIVGLTKSADKEYCAEKEIIEEYLKTS